jgi:uncharacterized protein YkwD
MKSDKNKISQMVKKFWSVAALSLVAVFASISFVHASTITRENILASINKERVSKGLNELTLDVDLSRAAQTKSKDMLRRNYFDHYAFGLSPWDFMINAGYDYSAAGENLAMNFNTTEGMVSAWMNSASHRDNILSPDYKETGIGIVKGVYTENGISHETIIVSDMFGQRKSRLRLWYDSLKKALPLY